MERMEEYQRMREEEAGRPVPAELACLETRVRARAAERPRRRRGPVLAAVCLCLVLGTGMAWGMGGFAALDDAQRKKIAADFPLRFRASSLTPRFRRAVWKPVFRTR